MELSSQLIYVPGQERGACVGKGGRVVKGEKKPSGKSLFLKGKACGLLSLSLRLCCKRQAIERCTDKGRREREENV